MTVNTLLLLLLNKYTNLKLSSKLHSMTKLQTEDKNEKYMW